MPTAARTPASAPIHRADWLRLARLWIAKSRTIRLG